MGIRSSPRDSDPDPSRDKVVFCDPRQDHAGKFIARLIFVPISSTAWCRGEAARWA